MILVALGLYLILNPGLFDDASMGAWSGLKTVAAQPTWGLILLVMGLARIVALYINGRHRRTPVVRLVASFFSAFVITQISLGMWNSGVPSTDLVVYPILVLADVYSAFRASADMTYVAHKDAPEQFGLESPRAVSNSQHS